jgi:hypothetical protein
VYWVTQKSSWSPTAIPWWPYWGLDAALMQGCARRCGNTIDVAFGLRLFKRLRSEDAANPRLRVGPITVHFSTDCYDTGKIIMEEERHVAVYQDAIREAERRTAQLNGKSYGSKGECEGACRDWMKDMQSILESPWRNGWVDFTHPVRRCDGSVPWF